MNDYDCPIMRVGLGFFGFGCLVEQPTWREVLMGEIMTDRQIYDLLVSQSGLRSQENDMGGVLQKCADLIQQAWIQERCTEKFEGIPCTYPSCGCSMTNQCSLEREWLCTV